MIGRTIIIQPTPNTDFVNNQHQEEPKVFIVGLKLKSRGVGAHFFHIPSHFINLYKLKEGKRYDLTLTENTQWQNS